MRIGNFRIKYEYKKTELRKSKILLDIKFLYYLTWFFFIFIKCTYRPSKTFFLTKLGFKKQKHLFTRFQGCFCEKWISILLILLISILLIFKFKITKLLISLANFHFEYLEGTCFKYGLYFVHFVLNKVFGQIWVKVTEWCIRLENVPFGARFTYYGAPFFHFEYKNNFCHILVKSILYKVSLLCSQSNEKQFQLVDLLVGRL